MQAALSIVTLPTGRYFDVGPVAVPWHGLFTAIGIAVGTALALQFARERRLSEDRFPGLIAVVVISGMVGARLFHLLEQDAGALLHPSDWLGRTGFSFYGAFIAAIPAGLLYLRRIPTRLSLLDAAASGFGLAMAIGRIGDILIGEHYGPPSDLPWAIKYSNPDASVPSTALAYQPGALYEAVLCLAIFAAVWPRRHRFAPPGALLATLIGAYSLGRFVLFFLRSDSDELVLGLSNAQVTSLALAGCCLAALVRLRGRAVDRDNPGDPT